MGKWRCLVRALLYNKQALYHGDLRNFYDKIQLCMVRFYQNLDSKKLTWLLFWYDILIISVIPKALTSCCKHASITFWVPTTLTIWVRQLKAGKLDVPARPYPATWNTPKDKKYLQISFRKSRDGICFFFKISTVRPISKLIIAVSRFLQRSYLKYQKSTSHCSFKIMNEGLIMCWASSETGWSMLQPWHLKLTKEKTAWIFVHCVFVTV